MKALSRIRSSPRALPTQRLPSRSSKSAATAPRGWPARGASTDTPPAVTRNRPPDAVPTQIFDPRSRIHNSELFVGVDSTELAAQLAALFDESIVPDHAFRVLLQDPQQSGDSLVWITEERGNEVRYESEPLASFFKRFWSGVFSIIVPEHLL